MERLTQAELDELEKLHDNRGKLSYRKYVRMCDLVARLVADLNAVQADNQRLQQWVNDLQSGMYVNCVYCGHRYGPRSKTPVSMAEVLKKHVESCPKHPMSALKAEIDAYKQAEQDGTLVRIPDVKPGDLLYEVDASSTEPIVCEVKYLQFVKTFRCGAKENGIITDWIITVNVVAGHGIGSDYTFSPGDIGKSVFLTEESARAALGKEADS